MNFKPLHDRVLIKPIEAESKTKGGIIIADAAKEKPQEGKVVAVGEGRKCTTGDRVAMAVKVGDKVLFGKWSGNEIKVDGEEYTIMKEDEIIGIYE